MDLAFYCLQFIKTQQPILIHAFICSIELSLVFEIINGCLNRQQWMPKSSTSMHIMFYVAVFLQQICNHFQNDGIVTMVEKCHTK